MPYIDTARVRLFHADCREALRELEPESIDSCVTDPPYELGFMGKGWDKAGVAFDPTTWAEVLRALKPGAHLLAFGGTRTYHRMACAIEDAGFEIRDSLHWMYGTGFCKSLNVGEGRGTALKPAHEPIVFARKPLIGTVAANVERFGTGAINVDGCRIGSETVETRHTSYGGQEYADGWSKNRSTGTASAHVGRFPANVLFSHSEDCTDEECAPGCAVAELDRQSGVPKSGSRKAGTYKGLGYTGAEEWDLPAVKGDSGGASRFFYVAKPNRKERDAGCEHLPACAGGEARNIHPTVKPLDLMRYLVRLVTPPNGVVLDPFTGSGTTGCAALLEGVQFVGCELDEKGEYLPIIEARLRYWAPEAFADTADISDLL